MAVSQSGLWMQQTAELWLLLQLTGSGKVLGFHSLLRFGPVLLFGLFGGLLSDRFDRRLLLMATQGAHALAAVVLTAAAFTDRIGPGAILLVVGVQGVVNAVDNPLRRGFLRDLLDDRDLANGIGVNSTVMTSARAVGPALAGAILATAGAEICFLLNAVSYTAVLVALYSLDETQMRKTESVPRAPGQIRQGLRYVRSHSDIRAALMVVAVVSSFAWSWSVILPLYAEAELGGGPGLYGTLASLISLGALLGALVTARFAMTSWRYILTSCLVAAGSLWLIAVAPTVMWSIVGFCTLGAGSIAFTVSIQSRIQLLIAGPMTGRVLALYSVGFIGSKPVGAMIAGWLMDLNGARFAFAVAGSAVAVAGLVAVMRHKAWVARSPGPVGN